MVKLKRALALGGYAALGPITGPLCAGIVRNLNKGRPLLAALYALAMPAVWLNLALAAAWAARTLPH